MTSTTQFDSAFFSQYASPQIRAIIEGGQVELKKRSAGDIATARAQIQAIADSYGVTVESLVGKPKAPAQKVAMRYRNPANAAQEWTGRGRQPKWVEAALADDVTLESMQIPGYVAPGK